MPSAGMSNLMDEITALLQSQGLPINTENLNAAMLQVSQSRAPQYGGGSANSLVNNMGGGVVPPGVPGIGRLGPNASMYDDAGAAAPGQEIAPGAWSAYRPETDVLQSQMQPSMQVTDTFDDRKALNALAKPKPAPRQSSAPGPVARNAPARDARQVRAEAGQVPTPMRKPPPGAPGSEPDVPGGAPPGPDQEPVDPIGNLISMARDKFVERASGANERWGDRLDRFLSLTDRPATAPVAAQATPQVGYGMQPGAMQAQQSMPATPASMVPPPATQFSQALANPQDLIGSVLQRAGGANERWAGRFPQVASALGQVGDFLRPGIESLGADIQGQMASPHIPTIPPQMQAVIDTMMQARGTGRTAMAAQNPSSMGIKKRKPQRTSRGNQGSRGKRGE